MTARIEYATAPHDVADIAELFREYAGLVAEAVCFQGFEAELAALPGEYVNPGGCLLIARDGDAAVGCVALRSLDAGTGEMKRMFVRPSQRGMGLGRRLAEAIVREARTRGYRRLVLDTLPKLTTAIALYEDLDFKRCPPYLASPTPGAICFERPLT